MVAYVAKGSPTKLYRTVRIRVIDNLCTFEIMPGSEWTKGECARHIYDATAKGSALAIYIGDSLTDEDAFRGFAKSGITIRVGKSHTIFAKYYFNSRIVMPLLANTRKASSSVR